MRDRTLWVRLLGGVWLVVGAMGLLWSTYSLLRIAFQALLPFYLPLPIRAFFQALDIWPWAQITVGTGALFSVVTGWGLMRRSSWVQTVVVPAHLLLAVYAIVGWISAYLMGGHSLVWWEGGSVFFGAMVVLNIAMAVSMNSIRSTEVLSWLPLRTAPIARLTCESCGTLLDPLTRRCPECESISEIVRKHAIVAPPRAMLTALMDEAEYRIEPGEKTLIGRGMTGNSINLSDPTVSRHHAQIEYEEGRYVLIALRDSNGTFINDTLIRHGPLQDGDEVRFGKARFRFTILELDRSDPAC